jgi:glycosyltransferase involved in cell wall biosynthesis
MQMADRLRVLFVIPRLVGGGAEQVVVNLLRHIDRASIEPTLTVLTLADGVLNAAVPKDVEIVELHNDRLRYALLELIGLIRTRRPDLVFSTLDHLNIALGLVRWVLPRKSKLVLRLTHFRSLEDRKWRWLVGLSFRSADLVVVQSREMGARFSELFGTTIRHEIINNPVAIKDVRIAARKGQVTGFDSTHINIVAVGRLVRDKGFDLLIEAFLRLNRSDLTLTILGEGPIRSSLEAQIVAGGVVDRVRLLGFKTNPYSYMAAADAFVLPSRTEGFPNVLLEALACGTPVVATPVPGVPELLEMVKESEIARTINGEAIAEAIERLLARLPMRVSSDAVAAFDVEVVTRRYESLFRSVCESDPMKGRTGPSWRHESG